LFELSQARINNSYFKNNIFHKGIGGSTRRMIDITGTPVNIDIDFNNYFNSSGDLAVDGGVTYQTLATWVAGQGGNASSTEGDPNLVNPGTDNQLTASSALCINLGQIQAGHPITDLLGNTVPFGPAPDIGAYERQA